MDEVLEKTDTLLQDDKFFDAYTFLSDAINNRQMKSPELQWRMARIYRDLGEPLVYSSMFTFASNVFTKIRKRTI